MTLQKLESINYIFHNKRIDISNELLNKDLKNKCVIDIAMIITNLAVIIFRIFYLSIQSLYIVYSKPFKELKLKRLTY